MESLMMSVLFVTECQERRLSAKPPRLAADTSDADELKVTATESVVGGAEQKQKQIF